MKESESRMKERAVLLGLHQMRSIGWKTIAYLKERLEMRKAAFTDLPEMDDIDIRELLGGGSRTRVFTVNQIERIIEATRAPYLQACAEKQERSGFQYITYGDDQYPQQLKEIIGSPWVLYYAGNPALLQQPIIAIVGTRIATSYGKRVARQFARELSEVGWVIVSGMARGIDSEAHLGALEASGGTIAVLGSPINTPYPRENAYLYDRIRDSDKGLILSEYPVGTWITKGMFVERNRIISGISHGTIVVEADFGSGSLITANLALAQNREVFGVPGPITSPKSAGILEMIVEDRARMVVGAEQIFEAFRDRYAAFCPIKPKQKEPESTGTELTSAEKKVLAALGDEPVTFDQLYEITQFDFGHLHSVLLSLLVKKRIEQQPGSSYILLY